MTFSTEHLQRAIASLIDIDQQEWADYSAMLSFQQVKKKEHVLMAHNVCRHVYFVNSGLLRIYFTDQQGRENTFHFTQEHDFACDYESFLNASPANYSIQALEDTELVLLSHSMVQAGYVGLRQGQKLGRILAERYFFLFSNKVQALYTQSPLDRFRQMNKEFPGILQRVPQHYIASFLHISPVHLSRLKNER